MSDRLDEILLEGMRFYGYHGVNPEERVLGQRFVDVAMAVRFGIRLISRLAGNRVDLLHRRRRFCRRRRSREDVFNGLNHSVTH